MLHFLSFFEDLLIFDLTFLYAGLTLAIWLLMHICLIFASLQENQEKILRLKNF